MKRREAGLPEELKGDGKMAAVAGIALLRNPGVEAVWTTRRYGIFDDGSGGVLFDIGDPDSVTWWAEGREATRGEVEASIELGLPSLLEMAEDEGSRAVRDLERMVKRARTFLPAEGS
jgi:hypothetical protein